MNTERIQKILEKVIEHRDYSRRIDQSEDDPLIELINTVQRLVLDKREAETSSLSKSVFLANLSHELRTPLNHIIGYGEMIQAELEDQGLDDLVVDLRKIRESSNQLMKWSKKL